MENPATTIEPPTQSERRSEDPQPVEWVRAKPRRRTRQQRPKDCRTTAATGSLGSLRSPERRPLTPKSGSKRRRPTQTAKNLHMENPATPMEPNAQSERRSEDPRLRETGPSKAIRTPKATTSNMDRSHRTDALRTIGESRTHSPLNAICAMQDAPNPTLQQSHPREPHPRSAGTPAHS